MIQAWQRRICDDLPVREYLSKAEALKKRYERSQAIFISTWGEPIETILPELQPFSPYILELLVPIAKAYCKEEARSTLLSQVNERLNNAPRAEKKGNQSWLRRDMLLKTDIQLVRNKLKIRPSASPSIASVEPPLEQQEVPIKRKRRKANSHDPSYRTPISMSEAATHNTRASKGPATRFSTPRTPKPKLPDQQRQDGYDEVTICSANRKIHAPDVTVKRGMAVTSSTDGRTHTPDISVERGRAATSVTDSPRPWTPMHRRDTAKSSSSRLLDQTDRVSDSPQSPHSQQPTNTSALSPMLPSPSMQVYPIEASWTPNDPVGTHALGSFTSATARSPNLPATDLQSAVSTLKPSRWVSGTFIDLCGSLLSACMGRLDTKIYSNTILNDTSAGPKPIDEALTKCIVIPMNHENEHWTLVHLDLSERLLRHYDSTGPGDQDGVDRLWFKVERLLTHINISTEGKYP